jgi:membrane-associated protease RseP (regulator of RpoE activity)
MRRDYGKLSARDMVAYCAARLRGYRWARQRGYRWTRETRHLVQRDSSADQLGELGRVRRRRVDEVLGADDIAWKSRVAFFLSLLTGVNLSMFLINLLPLPPFDGGHIMAAAWESVRRGIAKLRGRGDPGPVDLAKLMPVAYVVGLVFIGYSLMLVIADVVNPVRVS